MGHYNDLGKFLLATGCQHNTWHCVQCRLVGENMKTMIVYNKINIITLCSCAQFLFHCQWEQGSVAMKNNSQKDN